MNKMCFCLSLAIVLFTVACKSSGEDDPRPDNQLTSRQQTAQDLVGTWTVQMVTTTPEAVEASQIEGLELVFVAAGNETKGDFTASGAGALFGPKGEWMLVGESTTQLNLDNHAGSVGTMQITTPMTTMTVTFEAPSEPHNARIQGLDGGYELVLQKQ